MSVVHESTSRVVGLMFPQKQTKGNQKLPIHVTFKEYSEKRQETSAYIQRDNISFFCQKADYISKHLHYVEDGNDIA